MEAKENMKMPLVTMLGGDKNAEDEIPSESIRTPLTVSIDTEAEPSHEKASLNSRSSKKKKKFAHHLHLPKVTKGRKHNKSAREPADELKHSKNDWGMTYEEELESIDRFRKELSEVTEVKIREEHLSDERKLLRFLKARSFDLDKAKEMYVKHLKWRIEFDVDGILFENFPEREQILELMPQGYHMCDKEGRPIYIQYVGSVNVHKMLSFTDEETVVRAFIQEYEKFLHFKLPACSEASGKLIEQSLNILDVNGLGLSMLTKESQRLLKKLTSVTQDNYPEMMGKMIIINAPYIFKVFFSIVKPMLTSRTQSKIEVHGSRYLEKLLNYVDIECIPEDLGGTSKYTIADDVGPWSDTMPRITTKKELEEYDKSQALKWSRASSLHRSNYSVYFSDDENFLDKDFTGPVPILEDTESLLSDSEDCKGVDDSMNHADGLPCVIKPALLHWIDMLEEDFQEAIKLRPGIVGLDTLKFQASTTDKQSLLYRLEFLEARVIYCRDLHPTTGDNGVLSKGYASVAKQPSWLKISRSSSSSSLVTRMHILESYIESMISSYKSADKSVNGKAPGSADGNPSPEIDSLSSRLWNFVCCSNF